ncbi:MAG: hypothetical protein ABJF01_19205 [bacterium]
MASKNQKTQHVRIWISDRSGLPLRMDSEAAEGKLKTSMFFTYGADIRAPAAP